MKTFLEKSIQDIDYQELGKWVYPNLELFSEAKKELFYYQKEALENAIKVLYRYYSNEENGKKVLYNDCVLNGLEQNAFDIKEYLSNRDRQNFNINKRYENYLKYYNSIEEENIKRVKGYNLFNRMCFWMATASGKTIVIIKLMEILNYFKKLGLIPDNDILILLPREDLIDQLKKEVDEYNFNKEKQIELINLLDYEESKRNISLFDTIKIYYYRSDLIRNDKKESILNYEDYLNDGKWYIILDEAHRGEKETSNSQDYFTFLTKNGFMFNFSATFTEAIDYATTCYNFNLEKFINAGFGKNLYLSPSYYDFSVSRNELDEKTKQVQVLKSLIVFSIIKKEKKSNYYHNPLMITLVNSVNTNDSDLLMFFNRLEEIASSRLDSNLLDEAKNIIINDFNTNNGYMFGNETLDIDLNAIKNISIEDIREMVFNSRTSGKIEIIRGERNKELCLKLETSSKPFGLIKIGAADIFEKEKLSDNYIVSNSYMSKKFFKELNHNNDINILLGSRSFYEGWDSNRPNVLNFINIGGKDAKKYVLQGIGRGIRIEPIQGYRKRLKNGDVNKSKLLETLFVFATNKSAVKAIVETIDEQKNTETRYIELSENDRLFDLLIPKYKENKTLKEIAKYQISSNNLNDLTTLFNNYSFPVLLIKYGLDLEHYELLKNFINTKSLFQINDDISFENISELFEDILNYIKVNEQVIDTIKELNDEIIHFKHIVIDDMEDDEYETLMNSINSVKDFKKQSDEELLKQFQDGKITRDEFINKMSAQAECTFDNLEIIKLMKYYYNPLIYSNNEQSILKHIISVSSEVEFLKKFLKHIENKSYDFEWMFSKIDESLDNVYIPYYSKIENKYNKFKPDFIFWLVKDNKYRIVFVDPKGTKYTDYENKLDGYEKLFISNSSIKKFKYKNYDIEVYVKLVTDDINQVSEKYNQYWVTNNDFDWFDL